MISIKRRILIYKELLRILKEVDEKYLHKSASDTLSYGFCFMLSRDAGNMHAINTSVMYTGGNIELYMLPEIMQPNHRKHTFDWHWNSAAKYSRISRLEYAIDMLEGIVSTSRKELSPEQRMFMYETALKSYSDNKDGREIFRVRDEGDFRFHYAYGMCWYFNMLYSAQIEELPELFKPEFDSCEFYFNKYEAQPRIDYITSAIEKCKLAIKQQKVAGRRPVTWTYGVDANTGGIKYIFK